MKMQVVRKDGSHEVLTLTEPLQLIRGDKMNRLVCQTGMEHWFNDDGTYDGWGMSVNIPVADSGDSALPEDAVAFIEAVDRDREILP